MKCSSTSNEKSKYLSACRRLEFPKTFITFLLIILSALAFILSDYWNIPTNPITKAWLLACSVLLTVAWSIPAGGSLKITFRLNSVLPLIVLLAVIFLLNFRPLMSVIPWRGDESHHLLKAVILVKRVPWQFFLAGLVSISVILYLSWRRPLWAAIVAVLLLAFALSRYQTGNPIATLRYPYFSTWFFSLAPSLVSIFDTPYHEILYRVIPFFSAVALAWLFQTGLSKNEPILNILWGLAVATIPTVFYYSSITYLEMPAVFLMMIVCLRIEQIVTKDSLVLKQDVGWYALILLGFIKETTLPFILMCLAYRSFHLLLEYFNIRGNGHNVVNNSDTTKKPFTRKILINELVIIVATLIPISYYIILRNTLSPSRGFSLHITNLLRPLDYQVLGQSFFEQFGLFVLLFLGGCYLLIKSGNKLKAAFYIFLVIGYTLFYLLDEEQYIGYSRFNLFFLPPILAGAYYFIRRVIQKSKPAAYGLVILVLISSLLLSPIQRDGTKKPNWGDYLFNTSEHYYPCDEALYWLRNTHTDSNLLIAGLYNYYPFSYYFDKYGWQPPHFNVVYSDIENQDDTLNLKVAVEEAQHQNYDMMLFFQLGQEKPSLPEGTIYHLEGSFSNQSHTLLIYKKD